MRATGGPSDRERGCYVRRRIGSRALYFANIDPSVAGGDRQLLVLCNDAGVHVPVRQDDDLAFPDLDAHHERAKAAGATIIREPEDLPFGRLYSAADPEGHRWMFMQSG